MNEPPRKRKMRVVTLAGALRDEKLLGASFAGESWKPWHVVAKILSGEPLDDDETALALRCTGRTRLPERPPRRLYGLIGRRGAKSRFASAVAVHAAAFSPWRDIMAPGETPTVLLLAVNRQQAAICWKYCSGLLRASPLLAGEIVREADGEIELRNGAVIAVGTTDHRSIRGRSVPVLVGDESCYWTSDGESSANDEEVISAIQPSMAMIPNGGLTILISSAYRRSGLMYRRWQQLFGNDNADDLYWVAPSQTMNPLLPASVVAKAMEEDPARARSDYLSEWRDDLTDFLPADVVQAATDFGIIERPPQAGVIYKAFADPAGGTGGDAFSLSVGHAEPDGSVVVDAVRSRAPRFVPADVVREYAELLRSYRVSSVVGDRFTGGWCSDEFARHQISYVASTRTKSEIYLASLPLLLNGRARLVDNETLRKQLSGLVRRVHPGGRESVDHPAYAGAHDDLANSVCGLLCEAGLSSTGADAWISDLRGRVVEQARANATPQPQPTERLPWHNAAKPPAEKPWTQSASELMQMYQQARGMGGDVAMNDACWCGQPFARGAPVVTDGFEKWHVGCGPKPAKRAA
jgi:hypothetical protein